jgi:hypothetical protein
MNAPANCEPATNWEEIYTRLLAYTRSLAKGKAWFRGGKTTSFLMGKEAEDYTLAAIGKYLEEPDKYDPSKGELLDYLKYNLVRSLVANDLRKQENKLTDDVFAVRNDDDDEDNSSPYLDRVLPHIEALFPDDMDYEAVKSYIEAEIKDDGDVENIFLGIYSYGMKRREIIKEFGMEAKAYDNGMRRLTTVLDRAALHFNKNKQAV